LKEAAVTRHPSRSKRLKLAASQAITSAESEATHPEVLGLQPTEFSA
jgi:hypothetical protein